MYSYSRKVIGVFMILCLAVGMTLSTGCGKAESSASVSHSSDAAESDAATEQQNDEAAAAGIAEQQKEAEKAEAAYENFISEVIDKAEEYDHGHPVYQIAVYEEMTVKEIHLNYAVDDFDGDGKLEMIELKAVCEFDENGDYYYDIPVWSPTVYMYEYDGNSVTEATHVEMPGPLHKNESTGASLGLEAVMERLSEASFYDDAVIIFQDVQNGDYEATIVMFLDDRFDEKCGRENSQESIIYQYVPETGTYKRGYMTLMYYDRETELTREEYNDDINTYYRDDDYNSHWQCSPEFKEVRK